MPPPPLDWTIAGPPANSSMIADRGINVVSGSHSVVVAKLGLSSFDGVPIRGINSREGMNDLSVSIVVDLSDCPACRELMGSPSIGEISPNLAASLPYVNLYLESFDPAKRNSSFAKVMPRISPVERLKLKQVSMP